MMNKRYMDFVPKEGKGKVTPAGGAARPEIQIPEPRPIPKEEPVRLMPTQEVAVRTTTRVVRQGRPLGQPVVAKPTEVKRPALKTTRPTEVKRLVPKTTQSTEVKRPVPKTTRPTEVKRTASKMARPRPVQRVETNPVRKTEANPVRKVEVKPLKKVSKRPLQQRATSLIRKRRFEMEEVPPMEAILNDPLERPVSEFADLEELAQEIEEVTRGGVIEEETQFVAAEEDFSLKQEPKFGVVEDFRPRFIDAEVEKRPLSGGAQGSTGVNFETMRQNESGTGAAEPGIGVNRVNETGSRAGMNSAAMRTMAAQQAKMQIPKAKFINQNKVAKRPLSRTVYTEAGYGTVAGAATGVTKTAKMTKKTAKKAQKEVEVTKNRSKGGALGMVIAIILTVILGAVVGTVAFLILPR